MNAVSRLNGAPAPRAPMVLRRGKLEVPLRILGYGPEGVGKSTFASHAPSPIFLGAENGTEELDIARLPEPKTWDDVLASLDYVATLSEFQTIVVDPLNWLEPLCWAAVCKPGESIEQACGGYGKGYAAALDQWRIFLASIERLWSQKKMHVILLGHAHVKAFQDPEGPAYDRYELALHKGAAGLLKQWCAYVLFMRYESFSKTDGAKKTKGFSTGARVIHTQWTAAYDAKRRLRIDDELPLAWEDFYAAIQNAGARTAALKAEVARLLEALGDADLKARVAVAMTTAGDDAGKIASIANRLAKQLDEKGVTTNE